MLEMRIFSNSISTVSFALHEIYSADLLVHESLGSVALSQAWPLLAPVQDSATV